MNKFIKTSVSSIMIAMALISVVSSCKKEFDQPPAYAPAVNMTANTTIANLKARHTVPNAIDLIDSGNDIIIRGIVIADDRSGNLYKSIVIQDSTGGIALNINGTNLYTSYPIGTELFIKCNNLYLSDYNKQIQLGGGIQTGSAPTLADIPTATIGKYFFRGTLNNVIVPKDVTPGQLGTTMQDRYQNTLIRLSNFEFSFFDTAKTIASAGITSPSAASFDLRYCTSLSANSTDANIELRTSNYANFASAPVPNGNGTITAIYTLYGTNKQLTIRDASDINFNGSRCGTGTGGGTGGGTGVLSDISTIRSSFAAGTSTVPANTKITGIVISDRVALNTQAQNLVIQQGNGLSGIVVRFATATPAHTFNTGDSIDIVVSGGSLSLFSGVLQIGSVPLASATLISTGKVITPRVATIAQVNSSQAAWESTLVKMLNVTISSTTGTTWSGTTKFSDGTGNIDHFTRTGTTGATFGAIAFPTGIRPSITAIVSKFNTSNQVGIRNPSDVQ